jgi:parallel beta-helix repeat protein
MKRTALALTPTIIVMLSGVAPTRFVRTARARTIAVPDDYSTIQSAITNALTGDTIFVRAGTYYETLVIDKPLTLFGENKLTTIINANYAIATIIDVKANDVTISGFTIKNCSGYSAPVDQPQGILLESSSNCNISDNMITDIQIGCGIKLVSSYDSISVPSSNNVIAGNNITHCGVAGIDVSGGSNNTIRENNVLNNYYEVTIDYQSHDNTITGNYIANSTYWEGLKIGQNCANNTVVGNTFAYNHFGVAISSSSNNAFYDNNFVTNDQQVYFFGGFSDWVGQVNYWDNGKEGNYWSDYLTRYPTASEIDNTGIGDTPYSILVNQDNSTIYQDLYPLLVLFAPNVNVPSISVLSPTSGTYGTTPIALTFAVDGKTSWKAYSLDGQANVTIAGNITLPALSSGSHNMVVYAKRTAGNTGASRVVSFFVSTDVIPEFSSWIILPLLTMFMTSLGFAVYFNKRKHQRTPSSTTLKNNQLEQQPRPQG